MKDKSFTWSQMCRAKVTVMKPVEGYLACFSHPHTVVYECRVDHHHLRGQNQLACVWTCRDWSTRVWFRSRYNNFTQKKRVKTRFGRNVKTPQRYKNFVR